MNFKKYISLISLFTFCFVMIIQSPCYKWTSVSSDVYANSMVKLYATDGRTRTVHGNEVDKYLARCWYRTYAEVTQTLFSKDGKTITVYKAEIPQYLEKGWYQSPVADPPKPMVALTFDDGPSAKSTKRIVDTLVKHGARATFFAVGEFLEANPKVAKYALDNGMEIGNHTYNHPKLAKLSKTEIKKEISDTTARIISASGQAPLLFRPSYGTTDEKVLSSSKYPVILWSIDTLDWKSKDPQKIFKIVKENVRDGDIILMHDLYKTTADAVELIVPYLKKQGFQMVSVSTLAESRGYNLQSGKKYARFR